MYSACLQTLWMMISLCSMQWVLHIISDLFPECSLSSSLCDLPLISSELLLFYFQLQSKLIHLLNDLFMATSPHQPLFFMFQILLNLSFCFTCFHLCQCHQLFLLLEVVVGFCPLLCFFLLFLFSFCFVCLYIYQNYLQKFSDIVHNFQYKRHHDVCSVTNLLTNLFKNLGPLS